MGVQEWRKAIAPIPQKSMTHSILLADLCPFTANFFLMADFFYHLMIKENTYFSKI